LTRLIIAFELPENEIQSEVNFFALMFFVMAIVLLLAYACLGWVTNTISQVSLAFTPQTQRVFR
jgi:ATP-binding cassette subfamily B (MDR/TAP) protein 1